MAVMITPGFHEECRPGKGRRLCYKNEKRKGNVQACHYRVSYDLYSDKDAAVLAVVARSCVKYISIRLYTNEIINLSSDMLPVRILMNSPTEQQYETSPSTHRHAYTCTFPGDCIKAEMLKHSEFERNPECCFIPEPPPGFHIIWSIPLQSL